MCGITRLLFVCSTAVTLFCCLVVRLPAQVSSQTEEMEPLDPGADADVAPGLQVAPVYSYSPRADLEEGYRLDRDASYMIVAPSKVRPNMVYQMSVSILALYSKQVIIRASIRRDHSEEMAQVVQVFKEKSTRMLQMWIPDNADPGNYTLRIEGTTDTHYGGAIFDNETALVFDRKQCSVFIQMNKLLFRQGQTVKFRVLPVKRNLMSKSNAMDIYIEDATNTVVRRWLSQQTNAGGVLDMEFDLSEQPSYGYWKVKVYALGFWYEQPFRVDEFFFSAVDVNVSLPIYMFEDEYALGGQIMANFTGRLSLGQPVVGTVRVILEVMNPPGIDPNGTVLATMEIPKNYFPGVKYFQFTMEDIRNALPEGEKVKNKELKVTAETFDWHRLEWANGSARTIVYENSVEFSVLGDRARTFKPNQTLDIYFAAANRDGTRLSRDRRQVTVSRVEDGGPTTDDIINIADNGIAHYQFTAGEKSGSISVRAYYDSDHMNVMEVIFTKTFSPSESYLNLKTSTTQPLVGEYMVVTATTVPYVGQIYYVISAGGNIISGDIIDMPSRQRTFAFAVTRDMMPEAHLVAWFVRYGEVVADSLNFFVNGTRINDIRVRFNRGKDFTGDQVEVNSWTDPSSYIGFSGLDYELWYYGWDSFITEDQVIDELLTYDSLLNNKSFTYKWKRDGEEQYEYINFVSPSYGVDANQTFDYAGLVVLTDANVTRVWHNCNDTLGYHPCMDGTCYEEDQRCDRTWNCYDGQDEMGCEYESKEVFTPPRDRLGLVTRHYVQMGHWLWGGHFVMPNGRLDVIVDVPDEPMPWLMSSFGISRDLGFGFLSTPAVHQATRPFYMRVEGPMSIAKGEQIGIRVALFNYFVEDLEILITLLDSSEYKFVIVEDFGIVSSYNPRTVRGNIQTMVFLERGTISEVMLPVLSTIDDGCITVKISADAFIYGDYAEHSMCSQFDGVTNYLNTPFFIDLLNSGSIVLPDLEVPVPDRFVKPEVRQHLFVPGSPEAYVGLVGDVVGVGIFQEHLTTEDTLRKPYGSAEQSLYNFAYLLYNMLYLRYTNQLTPDVMDIAMYDMNIYFQRAQGYYTGDGHMGYFSMYRDYGEPTPSTWVTAFALHAYDKSQERDWELEFFMPTELLNNLTLWLCTKQRQDGAFEDDAPYYDTRMQSNQTVGDGTDANFALTAFVLIALAKAERLSGEAETCRIDAMSAATTYLETVFFKVPDEMILTYDLSLVTYALHLSPSSHLSTEAFRKFKERIIDDSYWANKEIPENDLVFIDGLPYYQPRRWYDNEGLGVESTAYGLLVYLRKNLLDESLTIMKWLQTMRNTFAGHASTKDSIVALESLVEYAKADTNRYLYNVLVTVEATSMGNFSTNVYLNQSNWPRLRNVEIYPVWGSVRGRAQGTGMVLMQLGTWFNVEYPNLQEPVEEGQWFDVSVPSIYMSGKNFSIIEYTACAKWTRPDLSEISGMAVLEVHVPTGYFITNQILREYAQSHVVPGLQAAEFMEPLRKVIFYFDYLNTTDTCVQFRMDRWYPAANMTIQHMLRVYDFFEPGKHNTTLYDMYTLFNLHICQVCGSFQCPYCKYYNSSPGTELSTFITISVIVAWILWYSVEKFKT